MASVHGDHPGEGGQEEILVLHLDDEESFVEMAAEFIERAGEDIRVLPRSDAGEALDALDRHEIDCVVSDYQMPGMDGLEFLRRVREEYSDLPFLLFTGKGSEELAGEAISAGVTDYLQKESGTEQFTVLANRIENTVTQHRAQQRVAETNRRIRRVHERITDAVVAIDEEWRYTYVNQQAEELLQREEATLLGETVWNAFPAVEGTEFETAFREAMSTQESRSVEAYFDPLDSWFELRAYPDEAGLSIYFRDVTERKERERRYEAIFNQTFQFTGLMEPDGTLIEANETALEFGGIERGDVVGKKVWDTYWFQLSEETRELARQDARRAAEGEFVRRELEVQGAEEPVVIDFSIRPITDESGEVTLLVPEGRDITELKEREAELREERAFTESLYDALPDVFYAFDEDGQFLRWNERLVAVTGYTDDEIAEMHPIDFVPEEDVEIVADGIETVVEEREAVTVEAHFETKGGEVIPYEFTGAPLTDLDGSFLGLVGIGRDVTERREREEELARKNERLEEFASVVSHDLRSPLSVAEGNVALVQETGDLDRLDEVEAALDRMERLIENLLHLAEQGQVVYDPEPVEVRDAVETAVTNAVHEEATVSVEGVPDEEILADESRLVELLENLLANAVEHGGEDVDIDVGLTDGTLYVADDGQGVPPGERADVFDPGYSTSEDGNGFGLSIVRSIVQAHGWEIDVTESAAGGARFEITGVESA